MLQIIKTLQISIKDVTDLNGMLIIEIDKILPTEYQLVSNYYSDNDLIIIVNITKSFKDGTVYIKEVSNERRRLISGAAVMLARIEVPVFDAYSQE